MNINSVPEPKKLRMEGILKTTIRIWGETFGVVTEGKEPREAAHTLLTHIITNSPVITIPPGLLRFAEINGVSLQDTKVTNPPQEPVAQKHTTTEEKHPTTKAITRVPAKKPSKGGNGKNLVSLEEARKLVVSIKTTEQTAQKANLRIGREFLKLQESFGEAGYVLVADKRLTFVPFIKSEGLFELKRSKSWLYEAGNAYKALRNSDGVVPPEVVEKSLTLAWGKTLAAIKLPDPTEALLHGVEVEGSRVRLEDLSLIEVEALVTKLIGDKPRNPGKTGPRPKVVTLLDGMKQLTKFRAAFPAIKAAALPDVSKLTVAIKREIIATRDSLQKAAAFYDSFCKNLK